MASTVYMIREAGKNGTVKIFDDRIVRTRKHRLGKDDVQTIPMKAITSVSHNRKHLGTDEVTLQAGMERFEWKVKGAEEMVAAISAKLYPEQESTPAPSPLVPVG